MTDFEKLVKIKLIEKGKTQKWLIDELRNKTGLYVDTSLLCRIYKGEVSGRVKEGIITVLNIHGD